jgi:flagellin FlaB
MRYTHKEGGKYMKTLIKNEEAQAGVGTLIIFIAMVLVAAVAAAVLLQTSGVMQSKSTTTTKEAAATIAENIVVESVDGVAANAGTLSSLNITVKLAAGGTDVDLSKVLLKVNANFYNYSTTTISANQFRIYTLRDPNNGTGAPAYSYTGANTPTLKAGSLARIDTDVSGLVIQSKQSMTIALTPEKGTTFTLPLMLPAIAQGNNSIYP